MAGMFLNADALPEDREPVYCELPPGGGLWPELREWKWFLLIKACRDRGPRRLWRQAADLGIHVHPELVYQINEAPEKFPKVKS